MKIIIFFTHNNSFLSGFFHELSVKFLKDRHKVKIFSFKKETHIYELEGIEITAISKGNYLSNYYHIFLFLKKFKPDVIISNFSYVNPALLFGNLLGVRKNIVWYHSLSNQINPSRINVFIKTQFLKLSDRVIANSYEMKKELMTIYKVRTNKLSVIPFWSSINSIYHDFKLQKTSENLSVFKIGCPGRLVSHKNQEVVIRALYKMKKNSMSEVELFIAGKGDQENVLRNLVQELDLIDQVDFLGHLSEPKMIEFYKTMDVIVLPSLHEAFGLVFIEAISLGIPVIVSNKFGALSFIEKFGEYNIDSYTFNPKDVSGLYEKLCQYYYKDGIDGTFFKRLYDDNFDKNIIYSKLEELLKKQ